MERELEEQQIALERSAVQIGAERYRASVLAAQTKFNELDTPPGERFTNRILRKFVPACAALQRDTKRRALDAPLGAPMPSYTLPLLVLPADVMAVITLRTVMSGSKADLCGYLTTSRQVSRYIKLEIDWRAFQVTEREKKKADPNHFNLAKWYADKLKVPKPQLGQKWLRGVGALSEKWPLQQQAAVGSMLLRCLLDACPADFRIVEYTDRKSRVRTIRSFDLTEKTRETLDKVHDVVAMLHPWRCPMVCPPKPWKEVKE